MTEPYQYVQDFQQRIRQEQYSRRYPSIPLYDDPRLQERKHVKKIEPQSQILSQSLLNNSTLSKFEPAGKQLVKPLVNVGPLSLSQKFQEHQPVPKRYNHNYNYYGSSAQLYPEPPAQPQSEYTQPVQKQQQQPAQTNLTNNQDYASYRGTVPKHDNFGSTHQQSLTNLQSPQNNQRMQYSSVGTMSLGQHQQAALAGKPSHYRDSNYYIPRPYYGKEDHSRNLKNLDGVQII